MTPQKSEREPLLMVAVGMKGVGKTYRTIQEIKNYVLDKPYRPGRKVVIFDVNAPLEASYMNEGFQTVALEDVPRLTRKAARRVVAVKRDRKPMTLEDKVQTLFFLLENFKCGMLVLEDINNYVLGAKSVEIIGAITTNRHKDMDIMIHLQSLSALDPRMWQNCTTIRLHHQLDNIDRYHERIPNYELMKIACLIVDEQYNRGNKRFFVYVKNLDNKIIGTDERWFRLACMQYLNRKKTVLNELMTETDEAGNLLFKTRMEAIEGFVKRRLHYIT